MTNYYQCLGLTTSATTVEVKAAYKEYAKNYHPDLHRNSEFFKQRFQEIQAAYEVLCDSTKHRAYDSKYTKSTTTESTVNNEKVKELNKKVSQLQIDLLEKEKYTATLLASNKAKDSELSNLKIRNSDYLSQIKFLSEHIASEKKRRDNPFNLFKTLLSILWNEKPLVFICVVIVPITCLFISAALLAGTNSINFGKEKIKAKEIVALADSLVEKENYKELLSRMNAIIKADLTLDTTDASKTKIAEAIDLYTVKAFAEAKLNKLEEAREDVDYVIKNRKNPSYYAYYVRAALNDMVGNKQEYREDITKSISINPAYKQSRIYRANTYYNAHDFENAIKDYRIINTFSPNDADNLNNIGNCYYGMRKYKSACSIWTRASQLGSTEARENLRSNCR